MLKWGCLAYPATRRLSPSLSFAGGPGCSSELAVFKGAQAPAVLISSCWCLCFANPSLQRAAGRRCSPALRADPYIAEGPCLKP